jgi:hypothetical protein
MILSAKVRRNLSQIEWLWHILDIGIVFGPTFGLIVILITVFNNPCDFYLSEHEKICIVLYLSIFSSKI